MSDNARSIGRYEILAEIGRGAMGVVYKARDPNIDRIVAVKTISLFDLDSADDQEYRQRFYLEARTAGRLSHPGIVTVFDVGTSPETGAPYLVMEYVAGSSLSKLLAAAQGRLPLGPALQLVQEIAEALYYAHSEGVIHRDIKPANILLTPEGKAKIADFGIARFDQTHLTLPGRVMGSPAYMAPEQLDGETTDARSDLFSLGVVLYTALTGHRPFQGNSTATVCFKLANRDPLPVSAWDLDLPSELDQLLARAMAKDPARRFQSGFEMAQALRRFREEFESAPEPLADIMRIIARPPLVAQKLVIAGEESPDGSLHTMVNRALAARPPAQVTVMPPPAKPKSLVHLSPRKQAASLKGIGIAALVIVGALGLGVWARHGRPAPPVPAGTGSEISLLTSPPAPKIETSKPLSREALPEKKSRASAASNNQNLKSRAGALRTSVRGEVEAGKPGDSITVHRVDLANLEVTIEHGFDDGHASIAVDNRVVYSQDLHGENKRRALLFRRTEGRQSGNIALLPGRHEIEVHVQSAESDYDASKSVSQGFTPGSRGVLLVKCDKRKKKLELQLQ